MARTRTERVPLISVANELRTVFCPKVGNGVC
nr:MAG TPA: hypothetical protein [Caudoviricetes sp.]